MRTQTISILEGNTFVVSDLRGDVDASPSEAHGLFHWDTRYLSRWKLIVDSAELNVLSTDDLQYFSAQFFLAPGTGTVYTDASWSIIRKRSVGDGFHEDLTVLNHGSEPLDLRLRLEAAADFADLFEVKDALLVKRGHPYRRVAPDHLVLGYQRQTYVRETWIRASAPEASFNQDGLGFVISVQPNGQWETCIEAVTARDGYVEYERRNTETGLENQCWKDSWNSILFADGILARLPRATCEIQGYVYDAKRRCARLARWFWDDPMLAERLEREAAELKIRFNRDFWLADRATFALALDGDKRPVNSLTSNIGHLLWSGIVDEDKIPAVVESLMSDRLFSGWGVRTMARGEGGYNPIGYHVGTVWPHDTSLIALGLQHRGYRSEATLLASGILEAATYFNNRLPEAFAGYERSLTSFPVEYPTACSPQAWATGAPLLVQRG